MKKVLIIGSEGQDGRLLVESCERQKDQFVGVGRKTVTSNISGWNLKHVDISKRSEVYGLMADFQPNEIYYLAAVHGASEQVLPKTTELFEQSHLIHVSGLIHFLEAMTSSPGSSRLFYASSSHIFGSPERVPQNETIPFNPTEIYGITKLGGLLTCRYYRNHRGLFASGGILYNHESFFRRPSFVSKRIVQGVKAIQEGRAQELILGDISSVVDWGYAPDYVLAMQQILALPSPDDFIIATGYGHTVEEFVRTAFGLAGIDSQGRIKEDRSLIHKKASTLIGDAGKLHRLTGWAPSLNFIGMVRQLLIAEGVLH